MVLIDTSIWVDLLGRRPKRRLKAENLSSVVTCPPVIQEVLQGIPDATHYAIAKDAFLAFPCAGSPTERDFFLKAADLFRSGRKRGITIRSSADCLIAAIALEERLDVWHQDRDFDLIARYTDLSVVDGL